MMDQSGGNTKLYEVNLKSHERYRQLSLTYGAT